MKSIIKRNLLSIILAGVIILMIPAIIIVPKKLDKRFELEGTFNRNGQMYESYFDYTAVVEKMSDGSYKATYAEKTNESNRITYNFQFVIPKDYEYGTKIKINDKDSLVDMVKVDIYPGHILIIGYSDMGEIILEQILRNEEYSEYNPVAETVLKALFTLLCVILIISVVIKFRAYIGIGATVVVAFLAVIISIREAQNTDFEGYYTISEYPEALVGNGVYSYNDIYLKKDGKDKYSILTNIVGAPMFSSFYYQGYECITEEFEGTFADGRIAVSKENVAGLGVTSRRELYLENNGKNMVICDDDGDVILEYRQSFGRNEYKIVYYIVRGIGVLMLLAVTIRLCIRDKTREKPDEFESYYGIYNIGELICAGEGYSDFALHAVKGIAGTRMIVEKKSFVINDNCYDKVTYEFDRSMALPESMLPAFKNAKIINVGVDNNRYYLLHTRKQDAVITTLGDKILMACKVVRNIEN